MTKQTGLFNFVFLLFFFLQTSLVAQKFGHLDSQRFMAEMPAAIKADKDLIVYRDKLLAATNQLQKDLDTRANAFAADYEAGKFTKTQAEDKYALLEKEQLSIFQRREEDETKLLKKREELFLPVFDQLEKAIKAVGKEQHFTFIFDSSLYNAILYKDCIDVTAAVKKKMGL
jgi:outer membrane protein